MYLLPLVRSTQYASSGAPGIAGNKHKGTYIILVGFLSLALKIAIIIVANSVAFTVIIVPRL